MYGKQVVFKPGETFETKNLGVKGRNLAMLAAKGLQTPGWIAISPAAFYMSLGAGSLETWPQSGMKERAALASKVLPSARLMSEIWMTIDTLGWTDELFAVRSSSREEDGVALSFAGQFESVLNVPVSQLAEAISRVWRSAFTASIELYRNLNGIGAPALAPSVIIQRMLVPSVAGVAFGADPVTGSRDVVTISAISGLADKLVSGEVDSATYTVTKREITKSFKSHLANMTESEILQVVKLVENAETIFGSPQDVEWAIQDGKLYVLQSRPVTGLKQTEAPPAEPMPIPIQRLEAPLNEKSHPVPVVKKDDSKSACQDKRLDLWDNSNIGESYPGVTTPLTFSFARAAYERVYIDFSKLMGVSQKTIEANSYIYPQMLGLINGRIYYNLINWYRLLAMFPGFKMNRKFMEQMMGVKCELPKEFLAEFASNASFSEKASDIFALSKSIPNLFYNWTSLPRTISDFNRRVESSFASIPSSLETLSASELYNLYRKLEKELLEKWDAPIINDFFAMIAYGLLKSLCEKWIQEPGIHNQLLCDETGIVSTEPAKLQERLAEIASSDAALVDALENGRTLEHRIASNKAFHDAYREYMEKFADRCFGELKLESLSLRDNPEHLFKSVAQLAIRKRAEVLELGDTTSGIKKSLHSNLGQAQRTKAERLLSAKLAASPVKSEIFNVVLDQARTRIRERENLRFQRTRAFGIVRRIFVELGGRLADAGVLETPRDVFYLEVEEVLRFIDGTATSATSLKEIASARKAEFSSYLDDCPPDRFLTRGGAHFHHDYTDMTTAKSGLVRDSDSTHGTREKLEGIGCCPGVVQGRARVVTTNPHEVQFLDNEILIAERTDPGWITLVAHARGIAVEYGSLLSHTAIVSRELGIPTVVSVPTVTRKIETGDFIEIDGAAGTVTIIERRKPVCDQPEEAPYVMQAPDVSVA